MKRACGSCTLCCRLLPVREKVRLAGYRPSALPDTVDLDKDAGVRCPHQCAKGCRVYERRPYACRAWTCAWLEGSDTVEGLHRPDRAGYVVDTVEDAILVDGERKVVIQIWVDPQRPDAWLRDDALLVFFARVADHGHAIIVRYDQRRASVVFRDAVGDWQRTPIHEANAPQGSI